MIEILFEKLLGKTARLASEAEIRRLGIDHFGVEMGSLRAEIVYCGIVVLLVKFFYGIVVGDVKLMQ